MPIEHKLIVEKKVNTNDITDKIDRMKILARLKNGVILMGLAAIALVYTVSEFLSITSNIALIIAPLLMSGVYGLNHLTDDEEDEVNQESNQLIDERGRFVGIGSIGAYLSGTGLAVFYEGVVVTALATVPMVSLLFYSFSPMPVRGMKRVKSLFIINSTMISVAWVAAVVILPVVAEGRSLLEPAVIAVAIFVFLRCFMSVEASNIPDIAGDQVAGVSTFPTKYGISGTKKMLYVGEFTSIILLAVIGVVTSNVVLSLSIMPVVIYTILCDSLLTRDQYQQYLSSAWDLSFALLGLIVFIIS